MSLRNKNGLAVLLRAFLLFIGWFGIVSPILLNHWNISMWLASSFPYQSSGAAYLLTIVYLGFGFRTRITGSTHIPRVFQFARFATAAALVVSFVFYCFVAIAANTPFVPHTMTALIQSFGIPILFIADFLLFDRGTPMEKKDTLWAMAVPAISFVLILVKLLIDNVFRGTTYYVDDRLSLFLFSDINQYGLRLFGINLGGLVWLLIFLAVSLGAGYLLRFLQLKTIAPDIERSVPDA